MSRFSEKNANLTLVAFSKGAIVTWVGLALFFVFLFVVSSRDANSANIGFEEFITVVTQGKVEEVQFQGQIYGRFHDGKKFTTIAPADTQLVKLLHENGVRTLGGAGSERSTAESR